MNQNDQAGAGPRSSEGLGVSRADAQADAAVDVALGLKAISIRLPRELLAAYKHEAKKRGTPYQALMRDVLNGWIRG